MAFNITGGITISNSVSRNRPNTPEITSINRGDKFSATMMWFHEPSVLAPHSGFRIEYRREAVPAVDWDVLATPDSNTSAFDISNVANLDGNYQFRIAAISVDSLNLPDNPVNLSLDSDFSATFTFRPGSLNVPFNVGVTATSRVDVCEISWEYDVGIYDISHFEVECLQVTATQFADPNFDVATVVDDSWRLVGTVSENGNSEYVYLQNGYETEDDRQYYRIRAIASNGQIGAYSTDFSDPFIPIAPGSISNFTFTRTALDTGSLSWDYDQATSPVRAFIVEASEAQNPFGPQATVTPTDESGSYSLDITGFASENDEFRYRVSSVGLNGAPGSVSSTATFTPVRPNTVTDFSATVNEGVGIVTSISLAWRAADTTTAAPDNYTTGTAGYLLEYRKVDQTTWTQIGTYASDVTSVEILPPQQGAILLQLITVGTNGLNSEETAALELIVSAGSATDDAIYNGDAAFIANRHFSIDSDDICMQHLPATDPLEGILPSRIEGGTFQAPTQFGPGFVRGIAGENLIIEWVIDIPASVVEVQRHFYLNLAAIVPENNPTRVWDVDNGNVLIEVVANPTTTNRFYEGPSSRAMYFNATQTNDPRFGDLRATGAPDAPIYVSRSTIRLNMRRVFTFRSPGFNTIRITFLADTAGNAFIPIPQTNMPATSSNSICFEAFASAVEETGMLAVDVPTSSSMDYTITFDNDYEEEPMVTATIEGGMAAVWISSKTRSEVVISVAKFPGDTTPGFSGTLNYTVRGY